MADQLKRDAAEIADGRFGTEPALATAPIAPSPQPAIPLRADRPGPLAAILVGLIFCFGVAAIGLAIAAPQDSDFVGIYQNWENGLLGAFVVAVIVFIFRLAAATSWKLLVTYVLALVIVADALDQTVLNDWADIGPAIVSVVNLADAQVYFLLLGVFSVGFAVVAGVRTLGVRERAGGLPASIATRQRPATRAGILAEDMIRRRIEAYFNRRPLWPLAAIVLGCGLAIFAVAGTLKAQFDLTNGWISISQSLFGLAILSMLLSERKRSAIFYFYTFVTLLLGATTVTNRVFGYPYAHIATLLAGDDHDALVRAYLIFWLGFGLIVAAYALFFQFIFYPRFHLATDALVDRTSADDFAGVKTRALERLGVSEARLVAEPFILRGFPDRQAIQGVHTGSWIGRDDRLRFTPQTMTLVAFTADQTLFYDMTVDLTTGTIVRENNVEFFFQDVSGVVRTTATRVVDLGRLRMGLNFVLGLFSRRRAAARRSLKSQAVNNSVELPGRDTFQIVLDSGHQLTVVLRDDTFFDANRMRVISVLNREPAAMPGIAEAGIDLPEDDNERVMRNIRAMLRDRKRALDAES